MSEKIPIPPVESGAEEEQRPEWLRAAAISEKGADHVVNEDAHFADAANGAFGVFDGVSKPGGGDVAAQTARAAVERTLRACRERKNIPLAEALYKGFRRARIDIIRRAHRDASLRGMGTTGTALAVWEDARGRRRAAIANIGDSRAYALFADGTVEQLTLDDGAVRRDLLDDEEARLVARRLNRAASEREFAPPGRYRQIRRWLAKQGAVWAALGAGGGGLREQEPFSLPIDSAKRPVKRIILATDGIYGGMSGPEFARILREAPDPDAAARMLRDEAERGNAASGYRDDMTAIVIEFPERAAAAPEAREGEITEEILVELPERKSIPEAQTFEELAAIIREKGGVQGSLKFYKPAELETLIAEARADQASLNVVTERAGVREKVGELLETEGQARIADLDTPREPFPQTGG